MALFSLKSLLGGGFSAPLRPERAFYAVGDIHGRFDLLERLLDQLDDSIETVFVGDYVDRGDDSAKVLRYLHELELTRPNVTCLMGNHEAMMLRFLEFPEVDGSRWLRNGGLQTVASFGVGMPAAPINAQGWLDLRNRLRAALGPDLEHWIDTLPTFWANGNLRVVHAAADPILNADTQDEAVLLWGHPDFPRRARKDGIWIVHGHTIVDQGKAERGVISVDTGAYASGKLTAALVETDKVSFHTA